MDTLKDGYEYIHLCIDKPAQPELLINELVRTLSLPVSAVSTFYERGALCWKLPHEAQPELAWFSASGVVSPSSTTTTGSQETYTHIHIGEGGATLWSP